MRKTDKRLIYSACLLIVYLLAGCGNEYTPKPRGYYRIDFPEKSYQPYQNPQCPFTFEYPVYAKIIRDSLFFNESVENPCWLTIQFPELNGAIHLSYKGIDDRNTLSKLIEDSHKMTFKHTVKADYIDEIPISNQYGTRGLIYDVGGNAASNLQFFLTDSIHHFIRGALYFKTTPNSDSLAPVIEFVRKDMNHMLQTFQWQ